MLLLPSACWIWMTNKVLSLYRLLLIVHDLSIIDQRTISLILIIRILILNFIWNVKLIMLNTSKIIVLLRWDTLWELMLIIVWKLRISYGLLIEWGFIVVLLLMTERLILKLLMLMHLLVLTSKTWSSILIHLEHLIVNGRSVVRTHSTGLLKLLHWLILLLVSHMSNLSIKFFIIRMLTTIRKINNLEHLSFYLCYQPSKI